MSDVTVSDVRTALGELDSQGVSNDTIQLYIDLAEDRVAEESAGDLSAAIERLAVIHIAKYRVFTSNRQAFLERIQSSRDTSTFNVSEKTDALQNDYAEALQMIQRADRPDMVSLGDR